MADPEDNSGDVIKNPRGRIEFRNVHFTYPSRPDIKILNGINLTIEAGESMALVGQSGCGKSTLIQLLLRFYDADEGQILIDGVDIKTLKLNYLRKILGFVQQEPVLMDRNIAENIRSGQGDLMGKVLEANYPGLAPGGAL